MKDDILKMLPHCLTVAKIMVSMDETFVERLPLSASNHLDLNGSGLSNTSPDRLPGVKRYPDGPAAPGTIPVSILPGRKFHQPCPLQTQKQFSTSHRLEHTVSLPPIPEAAKLLGDECPALNSMLLDNGADEGNITIGNPSAPDDKCCIHGPLYITYCF
jgi:hypothetical protein